MKELLVEWCLVKEGSGTFWREAGFVPGVRKKVALFPWTGKEKKEFFFAILVSSWIYTGLGSGGPITRSLRAEQGSSRSNYGGKV